MGEIYLNDGSGYKVSSPPFTASSMDQAQHPLFRRVYRYASDGKTLEDHTAEYLNADKVYSGDPMIAVVGGKVSLLFRVNTLIRVRPAGIGIGTWIGGSTLPLIWICLSLPAKHQSGCLIGTF